MVEEYLSYVTQSTANAQYVKNVMQALLTKPEELESLEKLLYAKVQQEPDVEVYSDLLIWVHRPAEKFPGRSSSRPGLTTGVIKPTAKNVWR